MTVQKAKKLLGEEIKDLADEQIMKLINDIGSICDVILDVVIKEHLTHKKENVYYG